MIGGATCQWLPGERLHLQHGPIDVVLKAFGAPDAVATAHEAARTRFAYILDELVAELAVLRRPISENYAVQFPVAHRMVEACRPHAHIFVTPMAAVAGAVADELMAVMLAAAPLARAYVNDGGDIAVHVGPGERLTIGVAGDFTQQHLPALNGTIEITHNSAIGGIATSGAHGRSFSLGIADSVTVLARSAAGADVAATLIANAVDIESPHITRAPATDLDPDSDLGCRLVTTAVGPLKRDEIVAALETGRATAERFVPRGLIHSAALMLRGETLLAGPTPFLIEETHT